MTTQKAQKGQKGGKSGKFLAEGGKSASSRSKKYAKQHLEKRIESNKKLAQLKSTLKAREKTKEKRQKYHQRLEDEKKEREEAENVQPLPEDENLDPKFFRDVEVEEEVEEDEEIGEDDDLDSDILAHREELDYLMKNDPKFSEYLANEEKGLLEFGAEELEEKEAKKAEKEGKARVITTSLYAKWKKQAIEENSFLALRKLVLAFKIATTESQDNEEDMDQSSESAQYRIVNTSLMSSILHYSLVKFDELFEVHLKLKKKEKNQKPGSAPGWSNVKPLVNMFLKGILVTLKQHPEKETMNVILRSLEKYVKYFGHFGTIANKFIKILLEIWSSGEEATRILAFIALRGIVLENKEKHLESTLKNLYLTFVRNAKFVNSKNLSLVNFMAKCVVEMYAINLKLAYQYAFVYIRQLAIHLRNTLIEKTTEAFANVYNWQFMNSLKVWSLLLSDHSKGPLQPLIYPLTQVILGVINLLPTSRYFPLRFNCIKMLNGVAASSGEFINIAPHLIEALHAHEFSERLKGASRPLDFSSSLKISKNPRKTASFQIGVINVVFELLFQNTTIYARSIAFPELIIPSVVMMRNLLKKKHFSQNVTFVKKAKQFIAQVTANAEYIQKKRSAATFGPQSPEAFSFLAQDNEKTPLESFYEEFVKTEAAARAKAAAEAVDDDFDDDDDDDNGDEEMEDAEEDEKPKAKKAKTNGKAEKSNKEKPKKEKKKPKKPVHVNTGTEDELGDLVLSDDE